MATVPGKRRYTIQEYLELERAAIEKHEYCDGEIRPLGAGPGMDRTPGGTSNHSLIAANVIAGLAARLRGKPCRVYDTSLPIRVLRPMVVTHADVTVICGKPAVDPGDRWGETITNPRLIVEVLSPATEAYDRGDKFTAYRDLESLEEYVLVSQDAATIETYWRRPEGSWLLTPFAGMDAVALLRSLDIRLPLSEVYDGVEWPPRPDAGAS